MAVKVKLKGLAEAEETRLAREEETDRRAELMRVAAEQLISYQDIALNALNRFARGWEMRQKHGWTWEAPDLEADPETWPPLAKVLWLLDQANAAVSAAQFLGHFREQPEWCPSCHPDEQETPKGYRWAVCPLHTPRSCVPPIARALGLKGWE